MSYRPKHFELYELVPRETLEALGERAWELLDVRMLVTLDELRDALGPCIVNDWRGGGRYNESGLRSFETPTGAKHSQHRFGRAADCKFAQVTPREAFEYIRARAAHFPYLTTLEDVEFTPTWLHFDVRLNQSEGIRIVRP